MWPRIRRESHRGSSNHQRIDWDSVLRQHDRWLRTIVYSRLGQVEGVDDVMQEVALAAVRESAPPDDPASVAPWLYRVAVRQVLMYRRKCGRRRKLTNRYAERHPPDDADRHTPDPLHWLLAEERRTLLRQALSQLPDRDVEILLLKYSEDWSYQQIASHLGISESALEARLHRARQRLREELAQIEDGGTKS
jgi:RNA polymerase sigma factor (sigma-70 family)